MALQSKKCEPRRVNHGDVAKMSQLSLRVIVRWLPICKYDTEQCLIYQGGPQNYRNIFEPQILQLKNSVEKREGEGRYFVFLANINKRACLLCWHNMKDYFYSPLPYAIPKKGNNPSIQSSQLPTYISICELTESFLLLTIFFFFYFRKHLLLGVPICLESSANAHGLSQYDHYILVFPFQHFHQGWQATHWLEKIHFLQFFFESIFW